MMTSSPKVKIMSSFHMKKGGEKRSSDGTDDNYFLVGSNHKNELVLSFLDHDDYDYDSDYEDDVVDDDYDDDEDEDLELATTTNEFDLNKIANWIFPSAA